MRRKTSLSVELLSVNPPVLIQPPRMKPSPLGPHPLVIAAMAGGMGMVAGMAVALLADRWKVGRMPGATSAAVPSASARKGVNT